MAVSIVRRPSKRQSLTHLSGLSPHQVVSVVHYAGRLLQRRRDIADVFHGFRVPNVASEPTDAEEKIAFDILRRIEARENKKVADLDEKQADKYIRLLEKYVSRRTRDAIGYNPERGRTLLAEMRATR